MATNDVTNWVPWAYAIYLTVSVIFTVWMGRVLTKNGAIFLLDAFGGRKEMADAVNKLLLVGFYLMNLGLVCLGADFNAYSLTDFNQILYVVCSRFGYVFLIIGTMHFVNLFVFAMIKKRAAVPVLST